MFSTPRLSTPQVFPTQVHPPESTLHPPRCRAEKLAFDFPLAQTTGDFRLIPQENRPPPSTPAMDPIDPTRPLEDVGVRACRDSNATAGIHFRHTTWWSNRQRVYEAFLGNDQYAPQWWRHPDDPDAPNLHLFPGPDDRARRFANCGTRSIVLQHAEDPGRYKVGSQRCHDRFCLPCMQDRARLIVANLRAQLKYEPTRFLTLTLKHGDAPLSEQLDRLYTSFTCLRRRQFWQDLVTGGVAFLELKLSTRDDCWHPHLHVLIRGAYVPSKLIADAWLQITGDSYIVKIQMVKSPDHLYSYLTRYVTKGWDAGIYRKLHALREAIQALKGRKLLASFGDFAHLRLLEPPTQETWVELGTLQEVITLAARRVAWALTACTAIFSPAYEPPPLPEPPDD